MTPNILHVLFFTIFYVVWGRDFVVHYCQTVDVSHYVPIKLFALCTLNLSARRTGDVATWEAILRQRFNLRLLRHGSDVYVTSTLSHTNPVTFQLLNPTLRCTIYI